MCFWDVLFICAFIVCLFSLCNNYLQCFVISFIACLIFLAFSERHGPQNCICDKCGTLTTMQHQIRKTSNESVFLCDKCYKELKTNAVSE